MFYKVAASLLLLLLVSFSSATAQQAYSINGYVRDASNGEALIGVSVRVTNNNSGTVTNTYGYYNLQLAAGEYTIVASYIGYQNVEKEVELSQNTTLSFELSESTSELEEVVITDSRPDDNISRTSMGVNKLDIKAIQSMPALLGEVDVVRSIQLLPGVSTVGEGATGFNVRGGGIDQNLILLDEAPVFNSSHLFGFFSVFNPDAVKDVKLIKGGIPAQYGGRLSSILDVRMKEGNSKRFSGNGGIGTVSSRFTVEGPITDKSSFIVTGRRSYADLFLNFANDEALRNNQAYFYDLSAKINYTINDKNKIYLSGYFGRDVFQFGNEFNTNWGNGTGTIRWNHLFNPRLFANFTLYYSDYDYALGIPDGEQAFRWSSNIINYSPKADFTYYLNQKSSFNFGAQAIFYSFKPGAIGSLSETSFFNEFRLPDQFGNEYAIYVDHELELSDRVSLQYGIRVSAFDYVGAGTVFDYVGEPGISKQPVNPREFGSGESIAFYPNLEPRALVKYGLNEVSSLKFSYNRTAQYIHLISNTSAASPFDIWVSTTNNVRPELADQVSAGYFRNFKDNKYETSVEVYYKTMDNQIDYVNGADLFLNPNLEADLLFGEGRAYGAEFYVKKNEGRFNGWLSYTLSRTERRIESLNNFNWYPNKYDRTHNLSLVGIYDYSKKWSFSANFSYATGVAITFPNTRYIYNGVVVPHNSGDVRNNYRVPDYHRMDLSATLRPKASENRRFRGEWVFSIYNLYARKNAYSIYFRQNEDNPRQTEAVQLTILGTILPSVTYNFNF